MDDLKGYPYTYQLAKNKCVGCPFDYTNKCDNHICLLDNKIVNAYGCNRDLDNYINKLNNPVKSKTRLAQDETPKTAGLGCSPALKKGNQNAISI